MTLLLALHAGGLAVLVACAFASVRLRRIGDRGRPRAWVRFRGRAWTLGVALGVLSLASFLVRYHVGEEGRGSTIGGLPFVTMWHEDQGGCEGFLPGIVGFQLNFLFWLLLPQGVLLLTAGRGGGAA